MSVIYSNHILGSHTSFCKNITDTIRTSINRGMYATQFFMGSSHSFSRTKIAQNDIDSSKILLERYPMHVFTHFPYVANLAGSKDCLAWNGDFEQDIKTEKILKSLEYELGIIANFNIRSNGVVIHPGNHPERKKGLKAIGQSINKINFPENSKLLLENSAGQGTSLATTFDEIREIYSYVVENKRQHIGVCIDTCHIYAYGLYNLSLISEVDKMFEDFDYLIGLNRLSLIHLNDSKDKFGSKKDRHERIGQGNIWGKDDSALRHLLLKYKNIPMILETTPADMVSVCCDY